jgi:hypothetical protein
VEPPFPAPPFLFLSRKSPATLLRRSYDILATPPPHRSRTTPGHCQNKPRLRFPPKLKLKPSSSPTGELASVFLLRCRALPPLTSFCVTQATRALNLGAQPGPSGSLFLLCRSPAQPCSGRKTTKLSSLSIHLHMYTFLKFQNILQIKYSCKKYEIIFLESTHIELHFSHRQFSLILVRIVYKIHKRENNDKFISSSLSMLNSWNLA